MLKGLFVNKTGMLIQQRRLDIAANNLANLNTVGFKKDKIFFHELAKALADPAEGDANRTPGITEIDFAQGTFRQTDNPLDVAIVGEGFFVIQGEQGEYYTRNGAFHLSENGALVNQFGDSVITDGGEVQLSGASVSINENGEILVDGQSAARLRLVTFDDPQQLVRIGSSYFEAGEAGPEDIPSESITVRAGYLEEANVDPLLEMVSMIELNRQYELGQKSIKTQDDTLDKLINKAGRSI